MSFPKLMICPLCHDEGFTFAGVVRHKCQRIGGQMLDGADLHRSLEEYHKRCDGSDLAGHRAAVGLSTSPADLEFWGKWLAAASASPVCA